MNVLNFIFAVTGWVWLVILVIAGLFIRMKRRKRGNTVERSPNKR